MEEKKSPKANLENKKLMFTQIGLIISLFIAWLAFEHKSYDKREIDPSLLRQTEVVEEEVVEAEVFTIVEEMPSYPGGDAKMYEYLGKNIKYPQIARESSIQGRVFVNFVVEPDGSVSNVKVLRGIGGGCDEEAMRVVKTMPKWKPGKQRGKAVRVSYTLPVVFKLQ